MLTTILNKIMAKNWLLNAKVLNGLAGVVEKVGKFEEAVHEETMLNMDTRYAHWDRDLVGGAKDIMARAHQKSQLFGGNVVTVARVLADLSAHMAEGLE